MSYRIVIPTAGIGSRLGKQTKYLNKSLVSIAYKPILSYLLEKFPQDCEFVIALGYKGQLVRDFLEITYPHRKFFFVNVDPYEGNDSGLGYSLICCEQYLQEPFVFLSCDTLVEELIPAPTKNWMGYAIVDNHVPYRTLQINEDNICAIYEKGEKQNKLPVYIGLAGINDYVSFWHAMHDGEFEAIVQGEVFGLRVILSNKSIFAHMFTWYDTGNPEALVRTKSIYNNSGPNILDKANEAIWFVGNKVIKFSDDEDFICNRVKRAKELKTYVPTIESYCNNMYSYTKIDGDPISKIITLPLFEKLLEYSKKFWSTYILNIKCKEEFKKNCFNFYRHKTLERVQLFYRIFNKEDKTTTINDEVIPPLTELFDKIEWSWLSDGLPGRFHGDFHFENILWDKKTKKFTFLDWRQDFAGDLYVGDIYYDLAKLMHGIIVSHEIIANNQYSVIWENNILVYDLYRKQILVECELYFDKWCVKNGFDLRKIKILTSLIYLNIAALHHYPYSLMLYALGKRLLYNELKLL